LRGFFLDFKAVFDYKVGLVFLFDARWTARQ